MLTISRPNADHLPSNSPAQHSAPTTGTGLKDTVLLQPDALKMVPQGAVAKQNRHFSNPVEDLLAPAPQKVSVASSQRTYKRPHALPLPKSSTARLQTHQTPGEQVKPIAACEDCRQ